LIKWRKRVGYRRAISPTRKEVTIMAIIVKDTVLMLESEVTPICPGNKKWASKVLTTLPIESVLKSNVLTGLLPCVGPEVGLKVKVAKDVEEFEKLKRELEAGVRGE
jgi:hypothetical protein